MSFFVQVSGKSLGARKEGSFAGKGKRQQAAGKAKAILSTKQLGSRGVKKRAGTVPVKAKSRDYVVKVRQYDRNGNGGGVGYGLGPKAGVVRRQNPRPKVVKDGTRETLNSRFEKIENPGRRDIRDGKPRAPTYSQRNNYGVILPL